MKFRSLIFSFLNPKLLSVTPCRLPFDFIDRMKEALFVLIYPLFFLSSPQEKG